MAESEKKEIILRVGLDKDAIPESITWQAPGASKGEERAEAFMLSLFSGEEKSTLGIDLWTKEMLVGDMHASVKVDLSALVGVRPLLTAAP